MFWKYFFVTLFLVGPSKRFLTLATLERTDADSLRALTDEELVDEISQKLLRESQKDKSIPQPVVLEIKNSGASDGLNLEGQNLAENSVVITTQKSVTQKPLETGVAGETALHSSKQDEDKEKKSSSIFDPEDKNFIIIIAVAVSTGFIGLMFAGVCYYKFRKSAKAACDVEYPAYGVTGPTKERIPSPGDRKLAQSAQMYHYQHQKQQMIAMEKANGDMKHDASDDDSEEDNVEGDYTVYECPGLAPTGEMEVKNPLFRGDETPVTPGQDITGQPHGHEQLPVDKENQ
ncbi:neural proliferation differentiation and control protein 1-like [Biomphalaria glabrata]|uniref:Neural proliferation differentiation and control protein 1-like n=1 Tax=Biomphalaria glabrata TaxID=6526 RepID=A0A9W3BEK2_BIOGL|nr:neural proliferation differentiation and control protein 1-like [Biomphalaria glabrata]